MNDWSGNWCCRSLPGEGVIVSRETFDRDKLCILIVEQRSLKPLGMVESDENEMLSAMLRLYLNPSSINQRNQKLLPNEDLFTYERANISLVSSGQGWSSPKDSKSNRGLISVSGVGKEFDNHKSLSLCIDLTS